MLGAYPESTERRDAVLPPTWAFSVIVNAVSACDIHPGRVDGHGAGG